MSNETAGISLAEIGARMEIERATNNYALGLDMRDVDRLLSAFHEDAVWVDSPTGSRNGHAEIADVFSQSDSFKSTNHFTMNNIVDFQSDDKATGLSHAGTMFVLGDGTYVTSAGFYHDRYEKRDGVWRISYRKIEFNHWTEHTGAVVKTDFS